MTIPAHTFSDFVPGLDEAMEAKLSTDDIKTVNGQDIVGSGNIELTDWSVETKTANYTVTDANDVILVDADAGTVTITLHAAATAKPKPYNIKKIDDSANAVTIEGNASETIDGAANVSTAVPYTNYTLVPNNATGGWSIL